MTENIGRHKGFTLAEVLITLVIIGVIAAMTIPTLIATYRRQETVSKLKKAYTTIAQALNHAVADNGFYDSWELEGANNRQKTNYFAQTYLLPYLQTSKVCSQQSSPECFRYYRTPTSTSGSSINSDYSTFILADGTKVAITTVNYSATLYIDINGDKEPNTTGYDIFVFNIFFNTFRETSCYLGINPVPYDTKSYTNNLESSISNCRTLGYCTHLIMKKNWQIDDDYPLKIK